MGSVVFNVIGLVAWISITIRLYLNLASVDIMLAICGVIGGLHVVDSAMKDLAVAIRKWRRDDR